MLYLSLAFFMVLPLFGVMAMEAGEVSPFVDEPGTANGAAIAYVVHLCAFFGVFAWVVRPGRAERRLLARPAPTAVAGADVDRYALACVVVFAVLALLMLFGYGGLGVLRLEVDKAEFRTSLGAFGALMTLSTKWFMPAFFAALVRACADVGWTPFRKAAAFVAAICLAAVGASWGFKTTVVQMLLPALILLSWKLSLRSLLWLATFVVANVLAFALFFDQHESLGVALDALVLRLTALQGDLAWYTWEKVNQGAETPGYLKTFLPIFGDGILRRLTGVDPDRDFAEWASYYFGTIMTIFGGYPVEGVRAGVNNQATLFGESLVAGGRTFFVLFSALFGAITGWVAKAVRRSLAQRRYAAAATLATYFSFTILAWTVGNGAASLLYLINIVGAAVTFLTLRALLPRLRARRPKAILLPSTP